MACVSDCCLTDLGYSMWPFTWRRDNLVKRLDKELGNIDWQIAFPNLIIPLYISAHQLLYLQIEKGGLFAFWRRMSHPNFDKSVEQ
ncbi:hypothetical protein Ahy_A01g001808 [Arachis hypogaea]|uniref:Uncharacterized protein n=1 Tax=Arachis hypogaea TaxID=3818 RepID=A0A445EPN8_ARAHY|nr:hypothetical protein Ahy_A01g001808 [Arachis hypogaea]